MRSTDSRITGRHAAVLATIAAVTLLLGGCGSNGSKRTDTNSAAISPTDYVELYRTGEYAGAYQAAAKAALNGTGGEGEQASLIAGQAAHAQGNFSDAQRWLRPLLDSSNRQINGQAAATLGLIAQQTGDQQQAADLLLKAGDKLTLDAAAKSQLYAGDSLSRLGKNEEAQAAWEKAQRNVKYDTTLATTIDARIASGVAPAMPSKSTFNKPSSSSLAVLGSAPKGSGAFTLQAGVFSTLARAVKAANEVTPLARRAGYENPRVVNTFDTKGKRVYAVRFGHFADKDIADIARAKFGSGVITTRATGE